MKWDDDWEACFDGSETMSLENDGSEAVSGSSPHTAGSCTPAGPMKDYPDLCREKNAFLRLLPGLLQSHRGEYVAIFDGQVIGHGTHEETVLREAWRKVGYRTVYVALVTGLPRPVERIPSPRNGA